MDKRKKISVEQFVDELLYKSVEEKSFTVTEFKKEDGSKGLKFEFKQEDAGSRVNDLFAQETVWGRLLQTIKRSASDGRH